MRHPGILELKNTFDRNVICLTMIPGIRSDFLMHLIDHGATGLILRGYGSGDIPAELFSAIEYAQEKEIPILVTTQCPGGATLLGIDSVGLEAIKRGVIQVFDMSMECMSTKLMWLLGQKVSYKRIKQEIQHNMLGEVDLRKAKIFLSEKFL